MCVTFLSFFIIQKAFNKYTAAVHLKMNELVSAHDKASNEVINIEHKTEAEVKELAKKHSVQNDSNVSGKPTPG
jgi:low affinity Fe/Cu permease